MLAEPITGTQRAPASRLKEVARHYVWSLRLAVKSGRAVFGRFPRTCPACGHHGRFLAYGYPLAADVLCPACGSLDRHRLLVLTDQAEAFFAGRDVLHFAPEDALRRFITGRAPKSYRTADLFAEGVDLKLDIERIALPDASVDAIVCLHVLEHVDDRAALREMHRVLRPGGKLLAMFPIVEGWETTFEDAGRVSAEDRLKFFGQRDHVRFYGRDARDRMAEPGFAVAEFTALEPEVSRYGLRRGEKLFVCTKAGEPSESRAEGDDERF